jgi:thiol-disulfide isomerase/thioredoxin
MISRNVTVFLLGLSLVLCFAPAGRAVADARSATEILAELDELKWIPFDRNRASDPAYGQEFLSRQNEVREKRAALILELYRAAPEHERVPSLMVQRWNLLHTLDKGSGIRTEVDGFLPKITDPSLRLDAFHVRGRIEIGAATKTGSFDVKVFEDFVKLEQQLKPEKKRGAELLAMAADRVGDGRARLVLENRVLRDYPDSHQAAVMRGQRRRAAAVGKPFNLEFKDAITGSSVSTKRLRGKVVVVDFWASWCVPCDKELPMLKELYAKYRGFGVEFIGVSLDNPADQGGLEALKKSVAQQGIPWPQYFQGKGFDGAFSLSWGIKEIPTVFVIDPAGNLFSVDARGKLDTIIPELIKAREAGQFDIQPVYRPRRRTRLQKP